MNVLSIGNSFSHDATRYLHRIAKSEGVELNTVTLYIGGCPLERHFRNMLSEREVYELFYNGEMTGFFVSLREALLNRSWDYITFQQGSVVSVDYDTYQPYLDELYAYVKKLVPKAKIIVHQTWAYETGSTRLLSFGKYETYNDMFADIEKSYEKAAKAINADMVIKSGSLMKMLLENGVPSVHRDGCHISFGFGRYAAALLWYKNLTGNDVMNNSFREFDVEVSDEEIALAKKMCDNDGVSIMKSIDYAKKICDTMMKQFPGGELPPVGPFHYHAGVFLHGMEEVYLLCGDKKYDDYIFNWVSPFVLEDGTITNREKGSVDAVQATNLLIRYAKEKQVPHFEKALKKTADLFFDWKLNREGGFWHLPGTPNQMWLDSVYMASLFLVRYGIYSGDERYLALAEKQFTLLWEHNRDKETGLLFHVWDESREADWANPKTGCSSQFWGRALGWYMATSALVAEILPEGSFKEKMTQFATELAESLLKFQNKESGMWYQVVDKLDNKDNWPESSCTCLFIFGICKLIQMGVFRDGRYKEAVKKAYNSIIKDNLDVDGENIYIKNVCIGTGVGDYEYYINRPTKQNDLHGTGAFTLMATTYYKTFGE